MNFKTDENLPVEAAEYFRAEGHDAHSVVDEAISGFPDTSIALICQREERILLTFDLDFADIRNYPPDQYPGIIVLRLRRQDKISAMKILPRILKLLESEVIKQRLWIVDEVRTRILGD